MKRLTLLIPIAAAGLAAAAFVGVAGATSPCVPGTHCIPTSGGGGGGGGGGAGGGGTTGVVTTPSPKPVPKTTISAPTLTVSQSVVDFGRPVVLSGRVEGAPAGQLVQLITATCGFSGARITAETKTRADGTFSFTTQPVRNASFSVRFASLSSPTRTVRVRPLVELRRSSSATFRIDVSVGGGSFFSQNAILQRYDSVHRAWRSVGRARLARSSSVTALVAVSSAQLHASVARGAKLRASVGAGTLGKCYAPATSAGLKA